MYDVWKNALAKIEPKVSGGVFLTWFANTSLVSIKDGVVTIGVNNSFSLKTMQAKYVDVIKTALKESGVEVKELVFALQDKPKAKVRPREVRVSDELVKKRDELIQSQGPKKITKTNLGGNGLNSRYTFDNFVVGSNNDLAVSAARGIVDAPGQRYNPFFLYGGPGLGKTHLVQAIGNELLKKNPDYKILYTPVSHFYTDFVDAVRSGNGKEFNQKFQKLDVLIIDDFQFIVGKDKSQEEFFNIFNDLYQLNKQIIVTSDRLPNQIKAMDERLASRLTWAGAFDLQLPRFEDKCAILRSKAEFENHEIEDEAIEYIAENINTNIRDLEGEFNRILATAELRGMTPLELIQNGLVSVQRASKLHTVNSRQIVDKVAKYYDLTVKDMCSKSRVSNIKNARQVAMFLLSRELGLSTKKIAGEVGVQDHTTVMHGIKKIEGDIKTNFDLREQIEEIKEKIYG